MSPSEKRHQEHPSARFSNHLEDFNQEHASRIFTNCFFAGTRKVAHIADRIATGVGQAASSTVTGLKNGIYATPDFARYASRSAMTGLGTAGRGAGHRLMSFGKNTYEYVLEPMGDKTYKYVLKPMGKGIYNAAKHDNTRKAAGYALTVAKWGIGYPLTLGTAPITLWMSPGRNFLAKPFKMAGANIEEQLNKHLDNNDPFNCAISAQLSKSSEDAAPTFDLLKTYRHHLSTETPKLAAEWFASNLKSGRIERQFNEKIGDLADQYNQLSHSIQALKNKRTEISSKNQLAAPPDGNGRLPPADDNATYAIKNATHDSNKLLDEIKNKGAQLQSIENRLIRAHQKLSTDFGWPSKQERLAAFPGLNEEDGHQEAQALRNIVKDGDPEVQTLLENIENYRSDLKQLKNGLSTDNGTAAAASQPQDHLSSFSKKILLNSLSLNDVNLTEQLPKDQPPEDQLSTYAQIQQAWNKTSGEPSVAENLYDGHSHLREYMARIRNSRSLRGEQLSQLKDNLTATAAFADTNPFAQLIGNTYKKLSNAVDQSDSPDSSGSASANPTPSTRPLHERFSQANQIYLAARALYKQQTNGEDTALSRNEQQAINSMAMSNDLGEDLSDLLHYAQYTISQGSIKEIQADVNALTNDTLSKDLPALLKKVDELSQEHKIPAHMAQAIREELTNLRDEISPSNRSSSSLEQKPGPEQALATCKEKINQLFTAPEISQGTDTVKSTLNRCRASANLTPSTRPLHERFSQANQIYHAARALYKQQINGKDTALSRNEQQAINNIAAINSMVVSDGLGPDLSGLLQYAQYTINKNSIDDILTDVNNLTEDNLTEDNLSSKLASLFTKVDKLSQEHKIPAHMARGIREKIKALYNTSSSASEPINADEIGAIKNLLKAPDLAEDTDKLKSTINRCKAMAIAGAGENEFGLPAGIQQIAIMACRQDQYLRMNTAFTQHKQELVTKTYEVADELANKHDTRAIISAQINRLGLDEDKKGQLEALYGAHQVIDEDLDSAHRYIKDPQNKAALDKLNMLIERGQQCLQHQTQFKEAGDFFKGNPIATRKNIREVTKKLKDLKISNTNEIKALKKIAVPPKLTAMEKTIGAEPLSKFLDVMEKNTDISKIEAAQKLKEAIEKFHAGLKINENPYLQGLQLDDESNVEEQATEVYNAYMEFVPIIENQLAQPEEGLLARAGHTIADQAVKLGTLNLQNFASVKKHMTLDSLGLAGLKSRFLNWSKKHPDKNRAFTVVMHNINKISNPIQTDKQDNIRLTEEEFKQCVEQAINACSMKAVALVNMRRKGTASQADSVNCGNLTYSLEHFQNPNRKENFKKALTDAIKESYSRKQDEQSTAQITESRQDHSQITAGKHVQEGPTERPKADKKPRRPSDHDSTTRETHILREPPPTAP